MALRVNNLVGFGFRGQSGFLLDDLAATELTAYSTRLLREDYSGSAMRIRRASDNAETDIGFLANGDLDESAITTHCSGTQGFVKTLYAQDGSNDATQTTTSLQPEITNASNVVHKINGKPALYLDSGRDQGFSLGSTLTTVRTVACVLDPESTSGVPNSVFGHSSTYEFHTGETGTAGNWFSSTHAATAVQNGTIRLDGSAGTPTGSAIGDSPTYMNLVTTGSTNINQVIKDRAIAQGVRGMLGEWIIWSDALDSTQIGVLEASQAAYWGI